jgi:hypothetical protein
LLCPSLVKSSRCPFGSDLPHQPVEFGIASMKLIVDDVTIE